MRKFCINEATTKTTDFLNDIKSYSEVGFNKVEVWIPKIEEFLSKGHKIDEVVEILKESNMNVVSGCFQGELMLSEGEKRKSVIESFRKRLNICKAISCPILVIPTDFPEEVDLDMYKEGVKNMKEAADIAKDYGVSLAIEFIQGANFLGTLRTTAKFVKDIERENVGILFDMFHFYAGKSKWEDFELISGDDILLVHLNDVKDVPREIMTDKDRVLPGEGIMPIEKFMEKFDEIGYKGYYSLEIFNEELWNMSIKEAVKKAYESLKWIK